MVEHEDGTSRGTPVPREGTAEFEEKLRMAKSSIPIVLVLYTLGVLTQQAFGMIYVNIGEQLGEPMLASMITSVPGIVLGITSVVYGALADFVSLRKMMVFGTIAFVVGSAFGCFGSLGIWVVILGRGLQTAGWQASGSVYLVLVSKYTRSRDKVVWYGLFVAIFRLAAAAGVLLAGYVTLVDWRILFAVGILEVLGIPALAKNLPNEHSASSRIDVPDFVLVGVLAGAVTMYFTDGNVIWAVLTFLSIFAFAVYLRRARDPFVSPRMLASPPFVLINVITALGYIFSYMITPGINGIGLSVFEVTSAQVSNFLVWSIILAAVMGFVAGPIIRKIGRSMSIALALLFMGAGLLCIAIAIPKGEVWTLALAPCVYYFGTSFFYQPVVDTTALAVEPEESGRALGFNGMVQAVSGSVGVAFFGRLVAAGSFSEHSLFGTLSGVESTYANVFVIGAIIVWLTLVLFLLTHRTIFRDKRMSTAR